MTTTENHNWQLGQNGEELAGNYLSKQGFRILHRNWNLHKGCELDIVAFKDNELHFIEVKTRSRKSELYGNPEQAINTNKLRNIVRAAFHYLKVYHYDYPIHFDAIGVVYKSELDYSIHFMPDISTRVLYSHGAFRQSTGMGYRKKRWRRF